MKKLWQGFLKFLRDPALTGVRNIVLIILSLSGLGIWGALSGWIVRLRDVYHYEIRLELWIILILGLVCLWLLRNVAKAIRRHLKVRKVKIGGIQKELHEVWGVDWEWRIWQRYSPIGGPFCPKHYLPMKVEEPLTHYRATYEFHCAGREGEEGHIFIGPKDEQLSSDNIYTDIFNRIQSLKLIK